MESNPYAPPRANIVHASADTEAEKIRREHIKTEAIIKSAGALYYLGAAMLMLGAITNLGSPGASWGIRSSSSNMQLLTGVFVLGLSLFIAWVAFALRRLRGWARIPTIIISCLGLLNFPIGTLINGYVLFNVISRKAVMVFSEDYKRIIAETPHIKYKSSTGAIALLLVLLTILGLVIAYAVYSSRS